MRHQALLLALAVGGCTDDGGARLSSGAPGQSGARDAGATDAAPTDRDAVAVDDAGPADASPERDARLPDADVPDAAPPDAGDPDAGDPGCALGTACNPIPVDRFPFRDARDTRDAPAAAWDTYACAPNTDEGGPEWVYRVEVPERGVLNAYLEEEPRAEVDVDVHLLDGAPDPDACIARDHVGLHAPVEPGVYFLAVDTWVDRSGTPLPGPYTLAVDFRPQAGGPCAMVPRRLEMFWRACDPGVPDCVEEGGAVYLDTPATGPVVKEAHLVTVADGFGAGWPSGGRDGIERHYRLSQDASGYVMDRREPWAPAGEGGSQWGQAAYSRPLPVEDEAWYVNMYWRQRPPAGTRMVVLNPANGRAVVAAGGYETGPGAHRDIGGASEEIHHYLGAGHRSVLVMGFAADPDLPLGPIDCDE